MASKKACCAKAVSPRLCLPRPPLCLPYTPPGSAGGVHRLYFRSNRLKSGKRKCGCFKHRPAFPHPGGTWFTHLAPLAFWLHAAFLLPQLTHADCPSHFGGTGGCHGALRVDRPGAFRRELGTTSSVPRGQGKRCTSGAAGGLCICFRPVCALFFFFNAWGVGPVAFLPAQPPEDLAALFRSRAAAVEALEAAEWREASGVRKPSARLWPSVTPAAWQDLAEFAWLVRSRSLHHMNVDFDRLKHAQENQTHAISGLSTGFPLQPLTLCQSAQRLGAQSLRSSVV